MRAIRAWLSCHLLLTIPAYMRAQERLSGEINDSVRSYKEEYQEIGQFVRNLDGDAIQRHQESAVQRLGSIEDKARANLLGITIGSPYYFRASIWSQAEGRQCWCLDGSEFRS